tara:strand:+ start:9962 stop:10456 length:495 start_codon:yes stop_codon:yes gene_type:complete
MPRTKLIINRRDLQTNIAQVEGSSTFDTRQSLAEAVADTDWAKNYKPKPITASVVLLRIAEFKIEPNTPKGKRGRSKGIKLSAGQKAAMQAGRGKKEVDKEAISRLRNYCPTVHQGLVDKIAKGSKVAAIKLKCLDCAGWNKSEIKHCTIQTCPLWTIRPYQNK